MQKKFAKKFLFKEIFIIHNIEMSKISNLINMDKASLKKLSKSELINLLFKQNETINDKPRPIPAPRRPIPTPRKYVKSMVKQYEENIISPPPEFRDSTTKNQKTITSSYSHTKNQKTIRKTSS